ncbi:MAG: family 20 glycosylhydrolase [Melioribacteraceae bacterium]
MKTRLCMPKTALILLILSSALFAQQSSTELNLMPIPKSIKITTGKFVLDKNFTIVINTKEVKLFRAAERTINFIAKQTGLFFVNQFPTFDKKQNSNYVEITVKADEELSLGIDESYELNVNEHSIQIKSANSYGAIRALSTLNQLVTTDGKDYNFPCVSISDSPRFVWRGLLIDVSRHFEPVDVIKRNLDAMAAVKMNVFHWHLTDDHGFRIECKSLPKLHELGSDGDYYTHEQILDIVRYATERGIRVVPEFDLPGHATSWLVGYPELASAPGPYSIERNWGIFNPTFDPTNEKVYEFLEIFFKEMSLLFPDKYWHIGGDENNGKQWDSNSKIQDFMKKNNLKSNHELQNYFNIRVDKILSKLNKTMVGWYTDEMPDLSKGYIVQAWKGRTSLYETAQKGYRSLLSHGFYIDLVQSTEYHYQNDPIPPDSILTDEVKSRILGGEATMWAEFVGPETIDSRIWPRTAAIAERLWSPSSVNNMENMFKRLDAVNLQLENYGLTHLKNYEMMMRRIVKNYNVEVLKTFVDIVNPLYTYSRDHPHVFKSFYPLTRIVDIAQPDPKVPREFDLLVEKLINSPKLDNDLVNEIEKWLVMWKNNHQKLIWLVNSNPILKEIEPLALDLYNCSLVGLEAMQLIKENKRSDEIWLTKSSGVIDIAKKSKAEVELTIVKSIEKLIRKVQ